MANKKRSKKPRKKVKIKGTPRSLRRHMHRKVNYASARAAAHTAASASTRRKRAIAAWKTRRARYGKTGRKTSKAPSKKLRRSAASYKKAAAKAVQTRQKNLQAMSVEEFEKLDRKRSRAGKKAWKTRQAKKDYASRPLLWSVGNPDWDKQTRKNPSKRGQMKRATRDQIDSARRKRHQKYARKAAAIRRRQQKAGQ